jgi:PAS domain S-box-containing protein
MQHNTALVFVLAGVGLVGIGRGRPRVARWLGAITAGIGAATLSQYMLGTNPGIDRLLIDPQQAIPGPHSGRMAANTALCSALLGAALVVLGAPKPSGRARALARLAAMLTIVLAVAVALAHAMGLTAGQGWGAFQMAPQTAALFLVLSGALLAPSPDPRGEALLGDAAGASGIRWLPLAASAGALIASLLAWLALTTHEEKLIRGHLAADAALVRQVLEAALAERMNVVARTARRWELSGSRTREQFELEAAVNRQSYPELRAIGWVGPDLVVRWVHPVRGNERALGLDVNAEPTRAATYARAGASGEVVLSPPLELAQGGTGMLAISALQVGGAGAGYVYAAVDPAVLLQRTIGAVARGQPLLVEADGTPVFLRDGLRLGEGASERFGLGGVEWRVTIWRRGEVPDVPLADVTLAVSAALSLMLGLALHGRMLAAGQARKAEAAERAAAASALFLQSVIDGAEDPIFVKDTDGRYLLANRRTAEVLGVATGEVRGRRDADFLPPDAAAAIVEVDRQVVRDGRAAVLEETIPGRGETHVFLTAKTPLLDREGQVYGVIGVARDITERKRAEAEVRRLNAELERRVEERTRQLADANAELEGFAHSVAHDLRAPLRAMQGFSQVLLEDHAEALDETAREYLGRIIDGAGRMDRLIQDLLAYARIGREDLRLSPLDLGRVVSDALRQLGGVLREMEAEVVVETPLPGVMAHGTVLGQVVANLVSNAAKFVPPGRRPEVRVWGERRAGRVRLWVADNGIGIAPEHQARIFQVFQRLHGMAEYPGTGIGLAIVRRGAERMGGDAGVESEPGAGSRFWVELQGAER